jgi:hypothetical protein
MCFIHFPTKEELFPFFHCLRQCSSGHSGAYLHMHMGNDFSRVDIYIRTSRSELYTSLNLLAIAKVLSKEVVTFYTFASNVQISCLAITRLQNFCQSDECGMSITVVLYCISFELNTQ